MLCLISEGEVGVLCHPYSNGNFHFLPCCSWAAKQLQIIFSHFITTSVTLDALSLCGDTKDKTLLGNFSFPWNAS